MAIKLKPFWIDLPNAIEELLMRGAAYPYLITQWGSQD
jgi:hypothetical protein